MSRPGRVRVAVTGLGVKTPAGVDVASAFSAVVDAKSLARRLDDFGGYPAIGCVVLDTPADGYFDRRELRRLDRTAQLGVAAALDAYRDAGLEGTRANDRWGVAVGAGGCGLAATMSLLKDDTEISAFTVPMMMPNATAAWIGMRLGVHGPALTYCTACTSGSTAIGEALRVIRSGAADAVIAGGAEAAVVPTLLEGFRRVGALSQRTDDPERASRPFDVHRDGFVMAEGAAFLVLERWDRAVAREARIYAELAGYGSNSDAFHIVAPRADGTTAAACMRTALADAGLSPADVGHINAHGTSTLLNDEAEARAIANCFGQPGPPTTATKGVTGHMIGGSGAFEAVVTVLSIANGIVPPVANHTGQSGDVKLDIVAGSARRIGPAPAVSNSFGFGGHNAVLVFAPADE